MIDGNGFEHRGKDKTGTLPTLFFDFSGHVNNLSVRLYEDGWKNGAHYEDYYLDLDHDISDKAVEAIRAAVNTALTAKNPSDVLCRDIERKEKELAEQKKQIADMKKALRRAKKKEGCA